MTRSNTNYRTAMVALTAGDSIRVTEGRFFCHVFFRFQAIVLSIVFPNFAVSKNITSCQDDNDKRAKPAFTTS